MLIKRKENKEMVKALVDKRIIFLPLVVTILLLSVAGMGIAADEPAVDRAAKAVEEKDSKDRALAQEKMRKLVQEAKEKINNTAWQIDLRESMSTASDQKGGKGKKSSPLEKDTLNFKDNKIESAYLISNGFTPTNFTVRLKGKNNDIVVWETMQTSADKGVAFWRGEIDKDVMRGVLSWQVDEQNKQDYSFISVQKGTPAPVAAPVVAEEPVAVAAVAAPVPPVREVSAPVQAAMPEAQEVKAVEAAPKPVETKAVAKETTPKKKGFAK